MSAGHFELEDTNKCYKITDYRTWQESLSSVCFGSQKTNYKPDNNPC